MNSIGCCILAGGKNSRMGGINKALLTLHNRPIFDIITDKLNPIFDEIIIVTNTPDDFDHLKKKYLIIPDRIKNIGPLGGIYSALSYTSKESVFFFPCDMPYINKELIFKHMTVFRNLDFDAVVPRVGAWLEPLHSIFHTRVQDALFTFIDTGQNYDIRSFLNTINVYYLNLKDTPDHQKIFVNLNTPDDLADHQNSGKRLHVRESVNN